LTPGPNTAAPILYDIKDRPSLFLFPFKMSSPSLGRMTYRLMGVAEVAELLGVSRQRVTQLAKTEAFPEPIAHLAAGPVWQAEDVERWAREAGRLPA